MAGPEWSKLEMAGGPPRQAWNQSRSWPATCGRRCGGPPTLGKSRSGSHAQTELWALVWMTPLLPTNNVPERGVQLLSCG